MGIIINALAIVSALLQPKFPPIAFLNMACLVFMIVNDPRDKLKDKDE
jgi:hypothetical protein